MSKNQIESLQLTEKELTEFIKENHYQMKHFQYGWKMTDTNNITDYALADPRKSFSSLQHLESKGFLGFLKLYKAETNTNSPVIDFIEEQYSTIEKHESKLFDQSQKYLELEYNRRYIGDSEFDAQKALIKQEVEEENKEYLDKVLSDIESKKNAIIQYTASAGKHMIGMRYYQVDDKYYCDILDAGIRAAEYNKYHFNQKDSAEKAKLDLAQVTMPQSVLAYPKLTYEISDKETLKKLIEKDIERSSNSKVFREDDNVFRYEIPGLKFIGPRGDIQNTQEIGNCTQRAVMMITQDLNPKEYGLLNQYIVDTKFSDIMARHNVKETDLKPLGLEIRDREFQETKFFTREAKEVIFNNNIEDYNLSTYIDPEVTKDFYNELLGPVINSQDLVLTQAMASNLNMLLDKTSQEIGMLTQKNKEQGMLYLKQEIMKGGFDPESMLMKAIVIKSDPELQLKYGIPKSRNAMEELSVGQVYDKLVKYNEMHIEIANNLSSISSEQQHGNKPMIYSKFDYNQALSVPPEERREFIRRVTQDGDNRLNERNALYEKKIIAAEEHLKSRYLESKSLLEKDKNFLKPDVKIVEQNSKKFGGNTKDNLKNFYSYLMNELVKESVDSNIIDNLRSNQDEAIQKIQSMERLIDEPQIPKKMKQNTILNIIAKLSGVSSFSELEKSNPLATKVIKKSISDLTDIPESEIVTRLQDVSKSGQNSSKQQSTSKTDQNHHLQQQRKR